MSYEHQMWLLDMVDELKLHPRVAKIRARTVEQEWEILDRLITTELKLLDEKKGAGEGPLSE